MVTPPPQPGDGMKTQVEVEELFARALDSRLCSEAATERRDELLARSRALHEESFRTRARARAVRDWSAALRAKRWQAHKVHPAPEHVAWFSVVGKLGDRPVWARWQRGRLECDPSLRCQAQLIVDLGTVFEKADPPAWVEATLTGPAAAVMLTLARACDTVTKIDFEPRRPASPGDTQE